MARYYDISISAAGSSTPLRRWTSYPNGVNDPGALNTQIDVLWSKGDNAIGNSTITVEGVPLSDMQQANQFADLNIVVKAGMQAGLPLANPTQAGVILQGIVYQAFGNWVGTDMNLNFVVVPTKYTLEKPGNFVFTWSPGQSLADAIRSVISVAYGNAPVTMNIGSGYATSATVYHISKNFNSFARFIKAHTARGGSAGVDMTLLNTGRVLVWDGSVTQPPIVLAFTDLVGQPKWVDANIMQFATVLRADITIGSYLLMPPGLPNSPGTVTTGALSNPLNQLKYKTSFQGQFIVQQIRHVGNFRDPDGSQWVSIFQVAAV